MEQVDEDVTLVNHIKHMFLALKDPLPDHEENLVQCNMNNSFYLVKIFFIQIWIHVCLCFSLFAKTKE